jgi:hypothetical protein
LRTISVVVVVVVIIIIIRSLMMMMMMTEMVLETSVQYGHLTRPIAREDSIEFSHRESSRT